MDKDDIRKRAIRAVNNVARQIGMDVPEDEQVEIVTPQFDRIDGIEPESGPTTEDDVDALREMEHSDLVALGMRQWDESGLMLFPVEWHDDLPEGVEIETISGVRKSFDRSEDLKEKRFGVLPFGIRPHDP